jgi:hypothetical protein
VRLSRIACACLCAAASLVAAEGMPWTVHGPDAQLVDGAMVLPAGFVAKDGDLTLMADAGRFAYRDGRWVVWAEGRVLFADRGVRIEAARLGLSGRGARPATGDAWTVSARFTTEDGRTVRATAGHVRFADDRVVLDDVHLDPGHGAVTAVTAPTVIVHLRRADDDGRPRGMPWRPRKTDVLHTRVDGIEVRGATTWLAGVPVLWLPWAYRDLRYDWPWTRYEVGSSRRQGLFARAWLGSDLPEMLGWRPRLELRGDRATASGNGFGAFLGWRSDAGKGGVTWYELPRERVLAGDGGRDGLAARRARVVDAEQRLSIPGGAIAGRWFSGPDADPLVPGDDGSGRAPDERFRADYLRSDLERRPLARRFVGAAWGLPLVEVAVDTQRNRHREVRDTERWWGVQAAMPRTTLASAGGFDLTLDGAGWAEDLRRPREDTKAERLSGEAALGVVRWFDGLGADARGGVRALSYQHGRIDGVGDVADAGRTVGFVEAGLSLRLAARFADTDPAAVPVLHTLTPRIGIESITPGQGRALPRYGFGDDRDALDEDRRWLVTGVATTVTRAEASFRADLTARWGFRSRERDYINGDGDQQRSRLALAEVTGSAEGRPRSDVAVGALGTWDGRPRAWRQLDGWAWWRPIESVRLRHEAGLPPPGAADRRWEHRPSVLLDTGRYAYEAGVIISPGGRWNDGWRATIVRRLVDGEISLSTAYDYGRDGGLTDRRIGLGISLGGTRPQGDDPMALPHERSWSVR